MSETHPIRLKVILVVFLTHAYIFLMHTCGWQFVYKMSQLKYRYILLEVEFKFLFVSLLQQVFDHVYIWLKKLILKSGAWLENKTSLDPIFQYGENNVLMWFGIVLKVYSQPEGQLVVGQIGSGQGRQAPDREWALERRATIL